ncbi:MAG TPA: biotin/lipoyl-binding protein, partial [Hyphomicrobium sp.]|nr:biotin/lipoyl-binding protein [Hyphomicrobium sp.]
MNRKVMTVVLLALATAGAAYYKGLLPGALAPHATTATSSATALADAAPMISVVKAQRADFRETVLVSGNLVAREEILVAPEIEGLRVVELFADEGSKVKKGDVLARLVSEQLDAQLAQNDASQARSIAAIAQADSQIVQAKA